MLSSNMEKTTSEKISSRMEDLKWDKPNIYFKIERHARTINGTSRAELHTWEINTDTWNASIIHHGHRQLRPQDKRLDTKVLAKVVAELIISETEHEYLKWKTPGIYCKLNMEEIIPATNKRTTSDRRSRFKQQLDEFLVNTVWETDKKWTSPGYIKASLTNSLTKD